MTKVWPNPDCILRSAATFPWQDWNWGTPDFRDLIVYQFHVGTWYGPNRETRVAKFLDVLDRIEYLSDLGVNAIEPLPIVEYSTPRSMGYNGSDLFSPEMDYEVDDDELDGYVGLVNRLLTQKGKSPLNRSVLAVGINQLKAMIEVCHHYGIAVIFDVVYNHASGDVKGQPEWIYFLDVSAVPILTIAYISPIRITPVPCSHSGTKTSVNSSSTMRNSSLRSIMSTVSLRSGNSDR